MVRVLSLTWLVALGMVGLMSCGDGSAEPSPAPRVAEVRLEGPAMVEVGETSTFLAVASASDHVPIPGKSFSWSSTNPAVAAVTPSGAVLALAPGTTVISATTDGVTGSATLTVILTWVRSVKLFPDAMTLGVGQTGVFRAEAYGEPGSGFLPGKTFAWTSSHELVATVSQTGVVTPLSVGSTVIAATTSGVAGSATVTVQPLPAYLEIHQINVGWGNATLIRGPDGTTVLIDAGNTGMGRDRVVPYLKSIGIQPADGLTYTIASHQHCDHVGGLDEVIQAGYDVKVRNYFNGSDESPDCAGEWKAAAATTTAGAPVVPLEGFGPPMGNGGWLVFMSINGQIFWGVDVPPSSENDRSIAVLVTWGGFDYLGGGDVGGGDADKACTGREGGQSDVETGLTEGVIATGSCGFGCDLGFVPPGGIDVLHVNNHGGETSTSSNYMNSMRPAVALIGTGAGQPPAYQHPRKHVVEQVLLAQAPCVGAPPALVLQTEEGLPVGPETSLAGYNVGDIVVTTDGRTTFTVRATGAVTQGPNELIAAGLPRVFAIDNPVAVSGLWRPFPGVTLGRTGGTPDRELQRSFRRVAPASPTEP